jgi:hypothetical protein
MLLSAEHTRRPCTVLSLVASVTERSCRPVAALGATSRVPAQHTAR